MSSTDEEFEVRLRVADDGVGVLEWAGHATAEVVHATISLAADDALIGKGLRRLEVALPASDRMGRRGLQRAGFRLEGIRREAVSLPGGGHDDVALYARLAGDLVYGPGGFTSVMNSVLPRKRLIAHVLVTDSAGRVCLLETTFKDDWELPGGIVNVNEPPRAGAVREIQEELGLDVAVGRILVADSAGALPGLGGRPGTGLRRRTLRRQTDSGDPSGLVRDSRGALAGP